MVLVAREANLAYIQVVGRGSFQNAGHLKRFYTEVQKNGAERFIIDLQHCTYLDSTFLGTMTGLGLELKDVPEGRLQVINTNLRIFELMEGLGLNSLFDVHITGVDYQPEQLAEVDRLAESKEQTGETMLIAHENLMQWDERNVAKFKDVVDYLREDLGQTATD